MWQSEEDRPKRMEIITRIIYFLRCKRNATSSWLEKAPDLARRLENALYRETDSFEEYSDMNTLHQRIWSLTQRRSSFGNNVSGGVYFPISPYNQSENTSENTQSSCSSGSWKSDFDFPLRQEMVTKIWSVLISQKADICSYWVENLPTLARKVEDQLYTEARSFNEYTDIDSLSERLCELVQNLSRDSFPQGFHPCTPRLSQRQHNTLWQSDSDLPMRRKMIAKIVALLQHRKPNASSDWIKRLPDMARRLEDSLYRSADSSEEYSNFASLKHRLQQLAMSVSARDEEKHSTSTRGVGKLTLNFPSPSHARTSEPLLVSPSLSYSTCTNRNLLSSASESSSAKRCALDASNSKSTITPQDAQGSVHFNKQVVKNVTGQMRSLEIIDGSGKDKFQRIEPQRAGSAWGNSGSGVGASCFPPAG